jgi:hypothetical protein
MIVKGVYENPNAVVFAQVSIPSQLGGHHLGGRRIEANDAKKEAILGVEDPDIGGLGSILTLGGLFLLEGFAAEGAPPDGFVQDAVQNGRLLDANRHKFTGARILGRGKQPGPHSG